MIGVVIWGSEPKEKEGGSWEVRSQEDRKAKGCIMEPIRITAMCSWEVREQCVPSSSLPHGSGVACGAVIAVYFEGYTCVGGYVFPEHPSWGAAGDENAWRCCWKRLFLAPMECLEENKYPERSKFLIQKCPLLSTQWKNDHVSSGNCLIW